MSAQRLLPSVLLRLAILVVLAGCAGPQLPRAQNSDGAPAARTANESRTLVMLLRFEPKTLTARVTSGGEPQLRSALFTAGLAYTDDQDFDFPQMAVALPALNTDSWRVYPDGRMETTYRLKPNLMWHDGTPLVAEDFVFARRVVTDPQSATFTLQPEDRQIEEVSAPDPQTVVFTWRALYADAGILRYDPLPRHVLEKQFAEDDPTTFLNRPYWTSEFFHLGPYRMVKWEPGSFIEAEAFAGYALGRPKIGRVQLRWSGDPNVVVSNLLSGAAHIASNPAITNQEASTLRDVWASSGSGIVLARPNEIRYVQFQRRPEYARPGVVTDPRVRRALAHSVDKATLADAMVNGNGLPAHTFVGYGTVFIDAVERAVVKYPFDVRRAEQLLQEAGLSRDADGVYSHPTDGRFAPELRGFVGGQEEREIAILADGWRKLGIDVSEYSVPPAQGLTGEVRSVFPALAANFFGAGRYGSPEFFVTSAIPRADNGWVGNNRGGYSNPAFDRLNDQFKAALDPESQRQSLAAMWTVISEDLAGMPTYYNNSVRAHVADLEGPPSTTYWNLHLWEWSTR